jgi:hypothetical protein
MSLATADETTEQEFKNGMEYAESMQELSNTVNGIWSAFPLKEKIYFLEKSGYPIEIPEKLKKIYG